WPKIWIRAVLPTIAAPPLMATAPPFTVIAPAASRPTVIELLRASPKTVRVPPFAGENWATTAGTTRDSRGSTGRGARNLARGMGHLFSCVGLCVSQWAWGCPPGHVTRWRRSHVCVDPDCRPFVPTFPRRWAEVTGDHATGSLEGRPTCGGGQRLSDGMDG